MLYKRRPQSSGIEISFEDSREVEVVRVAFQEHNAYLRSLGNDSSVSDYQRRVAGWQGETESYIGPDHTVVVDKLQHLIEITDAKVDAILDDSGNPDRIAQSARCYELGQRAVQLVESIQLQIAIETDLKDALEG